MANKLYETVVSSLEGKINLGDYKRGDKFPSLKEIADTYSVSSITAVRALQILRDKGLVESIPKKGTFVKGYAKERSEGQGPVDLKRVVVLTPKFKDVTFYKDLIHSIMERAQDLDIGFRLSQLNILEAGEAENLEEELDAGSGVIIVAGAVNPAFMELIVNTGVPFVVVDGYDSEAPCVLVDNDKSIDEMLTHLVSKGHRRVALFEPSYKETNPFNNNERIEAFKRNSVNQGIEGEVIRVDKISDLIKKLRGKNVPSAIAFFYDPHAVEFLELCRSKGIKVPKEVSVVGFCQRIEMKRYADFLSTFAYDSEAMAEHAMGLLVERAKNPDMDRRWVRVPARFVERKSIAKAT